MAKFVVIGDQIGDRFFRGDVRDGAEFGSMLDYLVTNRVIRPATEGEAAHARVDLAVLEQHGQRMPDSAQQQLDVLRQENARLRAQANHWEQRAQEHSREAGQRAEANEALRRDLAEHKDKLDGLRRQTEKGVPANPPAEPAAGAAEGQQQGAPAEEPTVHPAPAAEKESRGKKGKGWLGTET